MIRITAKFEAELLRARLEFDRASLDALPLSGAARQRLERLPGAVLDLTLDLSERSMKELFADALGNKSGSARRLDGALLVRPTGGRRP